MKKLIVALATFASLTLTTKLHADECPICLDFYSTLGVLTACSEVAGIGTTFPTDDEEGMTIAIHVDTPLFGCTNQQVVSIHRPSEWYWSGNFPTNGQRIVFLVFTNLCDKMTVGNWSIDIEQRHSEGGKDDFEYPDFRLEDATRSWFNPNAEDGLVFTHLTNIVHTMRTERNWTNYYEVVRSGFISTSERVSYDSGMDLWDLMKYANLDQLLFMQNDPLFPAARTNDLAKQIYFRVTYPNRPLPIFTD
jgi:hypothetical protein